MTSAEMIFMAGEDIDASGSVEANWNYLADYAEAYLSALVKYDIVTNWASLSAVYRNLFTEWAARFAGVQLIAYKFTGEAAAITRIEAEDRINLHIFRMREIEGLLKDASVQDFLAV